MSVSWTSETLGTARPWVDVCHNGSFYVAVAYGTAVAGKSSDGLTWSEYALPVSSNWIAVTWAPELGLFCAISYTSGTIAATSPDGETWTARTLPTTAQWVDVAWNGSVFCAIADGPGTNAATSPDGITWTLRTLPASARWSAVNWIGTTFVAISQSAAAATSPDGITWTARTLPASDNWAYMAWNGVVLCAVSFSTDNGATSPDGIVWTAQTLPTVGGWSAITAGRNGLFCALGFPTGTDSATSPDGATWTSATLPASDDWAGVGAGPHDFVAFGTGTTFGVALGAATPDANIDLSAGFAAHDSAANNLAVSLAEALTVTGAWTPEVLANLIERLHVAASNDMTALLQGTATDRVSFLDAVQSAWQLLLSENIETTGDALGTVHKFAALVDALAATGQANGQLTALAACTSALALEGLMRNGFTVELLDSTTLTEAVTSVARLLGPLVDGLQVSDDATPMLRLSCVCAESVAVDADPAALLRANADLSDGVLLYVNLRLGDTDYSGWALNTTLQAASEYRGLQLDSFASFRGKHYGAGPNGIVQFTGDSDDGAPIDAWLRTTLTHFGTGKQKRVPDAYIGSTTDGDLVLKTITRDPRTGVQYIDWYRMVKRQELGPGQGRVQIGRGLVSTWWSLELHNVSGSDFQIDSIELRPLVLDRRA